MNDALQLRDLLSAKQKKAIQQHLLNAWNILNIICGQIKNLDPKKYFANENDNYRAALDMQIKRLMEQFVSINNHSKVSKDNNHINDSISSIYVSLYPDTPIHKTNSFRAVFAYFYTNIKYSHMSTTPA